MQQDFAQEKWITTGLCSDRLDEARLHFMLRDAFEELGHRHSIKSRKRHALQLNLALEGCQCLAQRVPAPKLDVAICAEQEYRVAT